MDQVTRSHESRSGNWLAYFPNRGTSYLNATTTNKTQSCGPLRSMSALLYSEKYSDLTLVCKGEGDGEREKIFPLHRAVVCTQSEFFKRACDGNFIEARENKIQLHEDINQVKRMISFLYTTDYDNGAACIDSDSPRPEYVNLSDLEEGSCELDRACLAQLNNVTMYSLADKYIISDLKELSKSKFASRKDSFWSTISPHGLAAILEAVYTTTPDNDRGLRDVIINRFVHFGDTVRLHPAISRVLKGQTAANIDIQERIIARKSAIIYRQQRENLIYIRKWNALKNCFHQFSWCPNCKKQTILHLLSKVGDYPD